MGKMLNKEIVNDKLFCELKPVVNGLGMQLVDVKKTQQAHNTTLVSITITAFEGEAGIDECALVHRAVQPMLELEIGRDNLAMEVSTPGLQRIFRDFWEFEVFKGKRCRVYSLFFSSWITGIISEVKECAVVLGDYLIEDKSENGQQLEIGYEDIQKAKLEYKWEDVKNVRIK